MPGLSQLRKFNQNLLSIGDELNVRSSRGEKPVRVKIPNDIADIDDSEEFVLGMPEIAGEVESEFVDDDLSDLMGLSKTANDKNDESESDLSFDAPDMSSILNPVIMDGDGSDVQMPDLSMFEDSPAEEVEEEEVAAEPEEISIADMGLDALLAGSGFDGSEGKAESESNTDDSDFFEDFNQAENNSDANTNLFDDIDNIEELVELDESENLGSAGDIESFNNADDLSIINDASVDGGIGDVDAGDVADLGELGDLGDFGDIPDFNDFGTKENNEVLDKFDEPGDESGVAFGDESGVEDLDALGDTSGLDGDETAGGDGDVADLGELGDLGDFGDIPDFNDFGTKENNEVLDKFDEPGDESEVAFGGKSGVEDLEVLGDTSGLDGDEAAGGDGDVADLGELGDLGDFGDIPDFNDFGTAENNEALDKIDEPDGESDVAFGGESVVEDLEALGDTSGLDGDEAAGGDGDVADLGELGDLGDFGDIPDFNDFGATENNEALDKFDEPGDESGVAFGGESGVEDLDALGDTSGLDGDEAANNVANDDIFKDIGLESLDSQNDFSETDDIPDYNDSIFDNDESLDDSDGNKSTEDDISLEDFDTSAMDDMDFGIADTDSKLNGGFEMGNNDDFLMEGEFEIPGFSDVSTVKDEKQAPLITKRDSKKSKKGISEVDFSEAEESEELPPNTLSDVQYKQFLKNLSEYPLNVRLAFENLIVQDEFTDDAEFEIIEKILNKAPARQVASFLEKMLDTSIPVPRDFEHRTAEEYEAYKKSLSYQLRNRIIPACLIGITLMLASFGIFQFAKNCIYKPLKANSLYKQGYALLQADEYPQSEMKFEEACKYRISKKWFFNYARGYRNHKQYQRASAMYDRILSYFKHDKAAGLEYADMELNDMANYERAEEIVRREVLDYHINDADGILKLGDIFLEWGTEKDPEKLELAREQYANLLQLYGKDQRSSDLYLSRMMRYFIRTDNLKQVIPLKKVFEPREKSLCADDWAELSGYLLDKYYGTLAPSEEYLRYEIDGLRGLLLRAVKTNPDNPIAYYNLAKYFIKSGENATIENTLQTAIEKFNTVPSMKKRDIYKYIDSYRLLGEQYIDMENYLLAQEQFSEAISLFTTERDNAGFEGNADIGKLYEDMGNIKYSISGDYDDALINYKYSVELGNDTPNLRYRIGYIQYKKNNYGEALGSFMKAGDGNVKERNLMLAMANTLFMRGDDYAAQGYYSQLIDSLDREIEKRGIVFPQTSVKDYDVVNTYLYASNNYGVTLYNLAKRTGNSALNAQAIVQFSQSLRAWDALTRNQETLVRLEGSNLAQQNIQYITHQIPEFEPSIYTEISKTLLDNEKL